jgi:hypothetical protein
VQPTEALARIDQNLSRIRQALSANSELMAPADFADHADTSFEPQPTPEAPHSPFAAVLPSMTEDMIVSTGGEAAEPRDLANSGEEISEPKHLKPAEPSGVTLDEPSQGPLTSKPSEIASTETSMTAERIPTKQPPSPIGPAEIDAGQSARQKTKPFQEEACVVPPAGLWQSLWSRIKKAVVGR